MKKMHVGQKVLDKVKELLMRYKKYSGYLSFPYEWGERAIRGWLVYEIFHEVLGWPCENIVLGEKFDVLFVDEDVKPKLYLETKKPAKGLKNINNFKDRIRFYGTLRYAIITDGSVWVRFEVSAGELPNHKLINTESSLEEWEAFFVPLHARSFLYKVR
jgi:hypothetical protein